MIQELHDKLESKKP